MPDAEPNLMYAHESLPDAVAHDQPPVRLRLFGQQHALYEALIERDQMLAKMYYGALMALDHTGNPDRLAQAAHGIRELMEKFPTLLDAPQKAHTESLGQEVRKLEDTWNGTLSNTKCYNGEGWGGEIDRPLWRMLRKLAEFFEWLPKHHPRRKEETRITLRRLDYSGRALPPRLEERNVKAWAQMREFFDSVAHHHNLQAARERLPQELQALEGFLLDRLCPRTFGDLDAIDKIIREGEQHA